MSSCLTSEDCETYAGVGMFCVGNVCRCPPGYEKERFKDVFICRLLICTQDSDCGAHGDCVESNQFSHEFGAPYSKYCVCRDNFTGPFCRECPYHWDQFADTCDDCELCRNVDGVMQEFPQCNASSEVLNCACKSDEVIQKAIRNYSVNSYACFDDTCEDCSGSGICSVPEKGYRSYLDQTRTPAKCMCYDKYQGDKCQSCVGSNRNPKQACQCSDGYLEDFAGTCVTANCTAHTQCVHGYCEFTGSVFACRCSAGYAGTRCDVCDDDYELEGGECFSKSTCYESGGNCQDNAECVFNAEAELYECQCVQKQGQIYIAHGQLCALSKCEADPGDRICSGNGKCSYKSGSQQFECDCEAGYTGAMCSKCSLEYVKYNGSCVSKQTRSIKISLIAMSIIVTIAVLVVLLWKFCFTKKRPLSQPETNETPIIKLDPTYFDKKDEIDVSDEEGEEHQSSLKRSCSLVATSEQFPGAKDFSFVLPYSKVRTPSLKPIRRNYNIQLFDQPLSLEDTKNSIFFFE